MHGLCKSEFLGRDTECGMRRAWSFCRGQMPRDGETERTRRHVCDHSGEPGRSASVTAERWVIAWSTRTRDQARMIGEMNRLDKGMIPNIPKNRVEDSHKSKKHMLCLRTAYRYLSYLSNH